MFQLLLLALLLVPILEIYLLIQVGKVIGALPTILVVIATAILGATLLRQQGSATLRRVQQRLAAGELPAMALLEGVVILISGVLLLTPGFFTDALGLVGLFPPTRRALIRWVMKRGVLVVNAAATAPGGPSAREPAAPPAPPRTLEGEWTREE